MPLNCLIGLGHPWKFSALFQKTDFKTALAATKLAKLCSTSCSTQTLNSKSIATLIECVWIKGNAWMPQNLLFKISELYFKKSVQAKSQQWCSSVSLTTGLWRVVVTSKHGLELPLRFSFIPRKKWKPDNKLLKIFVTRRTELCVNSF